jgi:hypothetical protein
MHYGEVLLNGDLAVDNGNQNLRNDNADGQEDDDGDDDEDDKEDDDDPMVEEDDKDVGADRNNLPELMNHDNNDDDDDDDDDDDASVKGHKSKPGTVDDDLEDTDEEGDKETVPTKQENNIHPGMIRLVHANAQEDGAVQLEPNSSSFEQSFFQDEVATMDGNVISVEDVDPDSEAEFDG